MYKAKKIIEALAYLTSKYSTIGKLKLIKLLYLSDRYHLIKYGRTITDDSLFALPHGPVGSFALDVLRGNVARSEFSRYINKISPDVFAVHKKEDVFECLSDSDKEALDAIFVNFGAKTGFQLRDYTHTLPEWKRFEAHFKESRSSQKIKLEDLFSNLPDCDTIVPEVHIKESKEIFFGE